MPYVIVPKSELPPKFRFIEKYKFRTYLWVSYFF